MASRNKKKDNKKLYIAVILLVFLILLAILLSANKKESQDQKYEPVEEKIAVIEKDNITAKLQSMEERDRMEFYFGMFLDDIEAGDYDKAYDLLYTDFKEKYFPTIDSFTEYVQKTFSDMSHIEHENIERNGDVYVLWIYITDAINGKPGEKKEMNIVIKENDYNDFVMSFSVI